MKLVLLTHINLQIVVLKSVKMDILVLKNSDVKDALHNVLHVQPFIYVTAVKLDFISIRNNVWNNVQINCYQIH